MSSTLTSGRRRKPQEFRLPDGRKILVALPEDAAALRRKYSSNPDVQIEIVLHGSEEHQKYLRESQAHHEQRREELRLRHGPAFDEWENVHAQLDAVSAALERLEDQTSMLNANFSKFGYDAQLRTYDGDDASEEAMTPRRGSGPSSRAASRAASLGGDSSRSDWEDRIGGETIKLFKRPVIKQYFHKGLLWRASNETEVMCFELFFDLLYGELELTTPGPCRELVYCRGRWFLAAFVLLQSMVD
jgi:hypothetical protein